MHSIVHSCFVDKRLFIDNVEELNVFAGGVDDAVGEPQLGVAVDAVLAHRELVRLAQAAAGEAHDTDGAGR